METQGTFAIVRLIEVSAKYRLISLFQQFCFAFPILATEYSSCLFYCYVRLSAFSSWLCDLFPSCVALGLRPRATHEGNKSHNHELKADKRLIFTLARIPQVMQKFNDEQCLYCSSFFCFLTLHAGTGGIHRFLGFLIMLVFQSRISN